MKPFNIGAKGQLVLTEGITHILGYGISSVTFPSRASIESFPIKDATYNLSGDNYKIEAGAYIQVTAENPTLNKDMVKSLGILEGGYLIRVSSSDTYYIQPSSLKAVEGLR